MKRALAGTARRYAEALEEYARLLETGTPAEVARQQRIVSELLDTFGVLFDAAPVPVNRDATADAQPTAMLIGGPILPTSSPEATRPWLAELALQREKVEPGSDADEAIERCESEAAAIRRYHHPRRRSTDCGEIALPGESRVTSRNALCYIRLPGISDGWTRYGANIVG